MKDKKVDETALMVGRGPSWGPGAAWKSAPGKASKQEKVVLQGETDIFMVVMFTGKVLPKRRSCLRSRREDWRTSCGSGSSPDEPCTPVEAEFLGMDFVLLPVH